MTSHAKGSLFLSVLYIIHECYRYISGSFKCAEYVYYAGKVSEDDLEVLLSERAAAQIYQKWVDTLEVRTCTSLIPRLHFTHVKVSTESLGSRLWMLVSVSEGQLHE